MPLFLNKSLDKQLKIMPKLYAAIYWIDFSAISVFNGAVMRHSLLFTGTVKAMVQSAIYWLHVL